MAVMENVDWHDPMSDLVDDQWEPWEPDESPDVDDLACAYCGHPEVREYPDPFGQQRCCDGCFNQLIGGDRNDPPWRCGTEL